MKITHFLVGGIMSLSLLAILFINSIEIAAYKIDGFFEYEYTKYGVSETVGISTENLLTLTKEMMDYLRGDKDTLADIKTTINDNENILFFNEREIAHMEDVRILFIGAIYLRYMLFGMLILCLIFLSYTKTNMIKFITNSFLFGSLGFLLLFGILVGIIASDFSHYFVVFHHIFFNNDLWMLDPATDNLINIVPEGFFMDISKIIGIIFIGSIGIVITLCICLKLYLRKQNTYLLNSLF